MKRLKEIYLYPIKSLPGIKLTESAVKFRGLAGDRRMMLIDSDNRFMSLRERSELSSFEINFTDSGLEVKNGSIKIEIDDNSFEGLTQVKIWSDETVAVRATNQINDWFSEILEQNVNLVRMTSESSRNKSKNDGKVSFADQWPLLVLCESSVSDLNSRLQSPVTIRHFRPNLVVDNGVPYDEESWGKFSIGSVEFEGQGPIGRCNVVDMDPETGERFGDVLKTISSYRKLPGKIPMGLSALSLAEGVIRVGDEIVFN